MTEHPFKVIERLTATSSLPAFSAVHGYSADLNGLGDCQRVALALAADLSAAGHADDFVLCTGYASFPDRPDVKHSWIESADHEWVLDASMGRLIVAEAASFYEVLAIRDVERKPLIDKHPPVLWVTFEP